MTRLELKNIFKKYPNGTEAARNVSFTAEPGEFVVLVGPSGCGKSTILRMIAGLEDIQQGEICFDSQIVNGLPPKSRDVGMVFQNYALYPHLKIADNIGFPLSIRKVKKAEIKKRVEQIAEMLNITALLDKKPKEISGGERQRVALGRAIVRNPRLFLFDEPLSNLDAKLRVQMRAEIINLQKQLGTTSIYVTHDQTEAMTMGTKIIVLNKGEVMQCAAPDAIYNYPKNIFVAGFIGSPQMNFFEGEIIKPQNDDKFYFQEFNSEVKFLLNNANAKLIANKSPKCTIGIRPEKLKVSSEFIANTSCFPARIVNIEYLGYENLVFFKTDNILKSARIQSVLNFSSGDKVHFSFDSSEALFFDELGNLINTHID